MPDAAALQIRVPMRHLLALLLMLAGGLVSSRAASLSASYDTVTIGGRAYAEVRDWAKANGFEVKWTQRDKAATLTGRLGKIVLEADSRWIDVNGIRITLSFPIALKGGQLHVTPTDITSHLTPLLYPRKLPEGAKIKTICLDAGHGGKDPGNMEGTKREKDYTLLLSRELQSQLEKAGYKVFNTRSRDEFIDLDERPTYANRRKADLFISLHFNSAAATSASGIEVFCLTPAGAPSSHSRPEGYSGSSLPGNRNDSQNVLLAYQLQKSLVKETKAEDRGIVRARFAVLKTAAMPAVLVEGGFMSNPTEGRKVFDAEYRKSLAKGIVDGVKAYAKLVEH